MTMTVTGYSHVAVACTDLEATRRFYTGLFGFEELPRPDLGPGLWLRVGDLQLHFLQVEEMSPLPKGFPHFALHVPTEAFAATIEELRQAGVTFLAEPAKRIDFGREVWAAFVQDPAGNVVELTDVGPLS